MSHGIKSFLVSQITTVASQVVPDRTGRESIYFKNISGGTVYIGGADVAGTAGWPLTTEAGDYFAEAESRDAWYAIAEAGTVSLYTIEVL